MLESCRIACHGAKSKRQTLHCASVCQRREAARLAAGDVYTVHTTVRYMQCREFGNCKHAVTVRTSVTPDLGWQSRRAFQTWRYAADLYSELERHRDTVFRTRFGHLAARHSDKTRWLAFKCRRRWPHQETAKSLLAAQTQQSISISRFVSGRRRITDVLQHQMPFVTCILQAITN